MLNRPIGIIATIFLVSMFALVSAQSPGVSVDDVYIAHSSTVPVNRGERVNLFARRYRGETSDLGAVIVLSSDVLPADAGLGLDYEGHDLLERLAEQGFVVYAADMTGYGLSPKPQMDDGCNAALEEQPLLMPYPLYIPCEPSYTRLLTSLESDWDEVRSVVEYVREETGDQQVSLMGWSAGAARAAGYAVIDPDAVERLVLIAPSYEPDASGEVSEPYPHGQPLRISQIPELIDQWQQAASCEDRADFDAVGEALRQQVNQLDPTAARWGYELGSLLRSPGVVGLAGFNRSVVEDVASPTLVIVGLEGDSSSNGLALYEDLTVDQKIRIDVECGTRWLIWEAGNATLFQAISSFLASATVGGLGGGELTIGPRGEFR